MTLQQLRYVTTVAETGTISGAAKALFISQPSLTAAIQELEKEMGITIFLRTNRGVVLSREGDEFLGYARQVLMQAELLEERYGAQSQHKQQFAVSAQHYNFAARVFARVVRDMGGEKYSMAFRETTTYEVIEDVGLMRSEVGVLLMTEQNGEVLRRLFREYELTYTELVETGVLTPMQMAERMSFRPAQILGLTEKGSISEGKIADLMIFDPKKEYCISKDDFFSKGKNTPFDGKKVRGMVKYTIVDGNVVYQS